MRRHGGERGCMARQTPPPTQLIILPLEPVLDASSKNIFYISPFEVMLTLMPHLGYLHAALNFIKLDGLPENLPGPDPLLFFEV